MSNFEHHGKEPLLFRVSEKGPGSTDEASWKTLSQKFIEESRIPERVESYKIIGL